MNAQQREIDTKNWLAKFSEQLSANAYYRAGKLHGYAEMLAEEGFPNESQRRQLADEIGYATGYLFHARELRYDASFLAGLL